MSKVSIYLNFKNQAEEAFLFYQSVFGGEFVGGMMRMSDAPHGEGDAQMSESEKNLVLHVTLPILGGFELMGSDVPESMHFKLSPGNNMSINLQPDTRAEADRLFAALSAGGTVDMPMQEMFWGDYFGNFTDKFGVLWMIACASKE